MLFICWLYSALRTRRLWFDGKLDYNVTFEGVGLGQF